MYPFAKAKAMQQFEEKYEVTPSETLLALAHNARIALQDALAFDTWDDNTPDTLALGLVGCNAAYMLNAHAQLYGELHGWLEKASAAYAAGPYEEVDRPADAVQLYLNALQAHWDAELVREFGPDAL